MREGPVIQARAAPAPPSRWKSFSYTPCGTTSRGLRTNVAMNARRPSGFAGGVMRGGTSLIVTA